jgi:hypothetical protein
MLDLDELATGLSLSGYRNYWTLELHCYNHGDIRVNTDVEPESHFPCPLCNRSCHATWLGRGLTDQTLPTWERHGLSAREAHAIRQRLRANRPKHRARIRYERPRNVIGGKPALPPPP